MQDGRMERRRPRDATVTSSELDDRDPANAPTLDTAAGLASAVPLAAGTRIGRFLVVDRLGAGGMGVVYAAYDPVLDRKIALKLLHPSARSPDQMVLRLRREAQAAARLSHRNVVTVYDVGIAAVEDRGSDVFVAMELIDGGTLDTWASAQPRRWDETLRMYLAAGRGLAAAHAAGVVHRDFKPSNVLVGADGEPRVSDFGIASTAEVAEATASELAPDVAAAALSVGTLTRTGAVMGTPAFMAPEQRSGAQVDARADQYAFCVALFRATYGHHPYGEQLRELERRAAAHELIEPRDRRGAPAALLPVLRRGLAPDPDARFADMPSLLRALERVAAARRRRRIALVAALALAATGSGAAWALHGTSTAAPCAGARAELARTWNPAQRERITRGFAATGVGFAASAAERVLGHLDRWGAGWVNARTEACTATRVHRTQTEPQLALRVACLDRQRDDLRAMVDYLATAGADTLPRAAQIALGLPQVSACEDPVALAARVPASIPPDALAAMARRLGDAQVRGDAGRYVEAVPLASEVLIEARQRDARALAGEAGLSLGRLEARAGMTALARDTLFAAALDAQVTGQHATAADAWSQSIFTMQMQNAPVEDEARAYALGRAALEAAGNPPLTEARLLTNHAGFIDMTARDPAAAIPLYQRARALVRERVDPEQPLVAAILDDLGGTLFEAGRRAEGIAMSEQALAAHDRIYGPEHPVTANVIHNLAIEYADSGDAARAEPLFRRALELKAATLGPTHPSVSNTLIEYGETLAVLGRFDEALALARRDLALWEAHSGPRSPEAAQSHEALAYNLLAAGRPADCVDEYRIAIPMLAAIDSDGVVAARNDRVELARCLTLAGRPRDAAAELQTVVAEDPAAARRSSLLRERARIALAQHQTAAALARLREAEAALPASPRLKIVAELDALTGEALHAAGDRARARERADKVRAACVLEDCGVWTRSLLARAQAVSR